MEEAVKFFKNANQFSLHIEKMVQEHKLSHMDAVLKFCADNLLEPEDVAKRINRVLKEKIALEMMELNYLPKQAKLDI